MAAAVPGDAGGYWFDHEPLIRQRDGGDHPTIDAFRSRWREGSLRDRAAAVRGLRPDRVVRDWWTATPPSTRLKEFADANGLRHVQQFIGTPERRDEANLPALSGWPFVLGEFNDVLATGAGCYLEFGNHVRASRGVHWGYVAIRCEGARLPPVLIDAAANDAEPSSFSRPMKFLLQVQEGATSLHPRGTAGLQKTGWVRIDPASGAAPGFVVYSRQGHEAAGRALLTPSAMDLLRTTTTAFDLELHGEWLFLYGYDFDVSTLEPDRWAWIFSLASRWLDQLDAWDALPVPGIMEDLPFYTRDVRPAPPPLDEHVPRPPIDGNAIDRALWGNNNDGGLLG